MLKPHIKVKHVGEDHMKRIQAAVKKAHGSYVEVGWPEGKRYPGTDISTAQTALWNEFGTTSAPARPFMRPAIDENKKLLEDARTDAVTKVAFAGVNIEQALFELGTTAKDLIVAKINSNVPPPNAPSTLARKEAKGHGSQTLIDTGLMRDSLEVKVTLSKPLQQEKEAKAKIAEQRAKKASERKEQRQAYKAAKRAAKLKQREQAKKVKNARKQVKVAVKKGVKGAKKEVKKTAQKAVRAVKKSGKQAAKATAKAQVKTTKTLAKGLASAGKAERKGIIAAHKKLVKVIANTKKVVKRTVRQTQKTVSKAVKQTAQSVTSSRKSATKTLKSASQRIKAAKPKGGPKR